ncbi:MAG: hypothetical protein IPO04_00140 [Cytophagaceae bacterium]|nr:hypothetical protein [Cytophagaceae bacterium]
MNITKPKVIKDYDKLTEEMQEGIREFYPGGYADHLIRFTDREGKYVSALPFETEDKYYLIRMTNSEAIKLAKDEAVNDEEEDSTKDDEKDGYDDTYTDLDSMRVGSGRKSDEDEDYD